MLIAIEPDAIEIVELGSRTRTQRFAVADACAVAGFDDQLWIATRDQLVRLDRHGGHPIGEPRPLPFSTQRTLSSGNRLSAPWQLSAPIVSSIAR